MTIEEKFEEYWEKVKDNYDYGFKFVMKLMWLTGYKVGYGDAYGIGEK